MPRRHQFRKSIGRGKELDRIAAECKTAKGVKLMVQPKTDGKGKEGKGWCSALSGIIKPADKGKEGKGWFSDIFRKVPFVGNVIGDTMDTAYNKAIPGQNKVFGDNTVLGNIGKNLVSSAVDPYINAARSAVGQGLAPMKSGAGPSRRVSAWLTHVQETRSKNPTMSFRDALSAAHATYHKK